jgi:predicted regulator of Ras-like GTPase activity (Roadblock/LC7/MglB family)
LAHRSSIFPPVDANDALERLLEVSEEIRAAVVFAQGEPIASNLPEDQAADVARLADAMLAYAATLRAKVAVTQLHAVTPAGDVYVARRGDRGVVAIATAASLEGLVQHDLRTLLGSLPRSRRKAVATA